MPSTFPKVRYADPLFFILGFVPMARTNKSVRQNLWRRFNERTGRDPTDEELCAMIDLCDSFREVCSNLIERYGAFADSPAKTMIEPQIRYYSHLVSGLSWIASTIVNIHESTHNVTGIGASRRRSDKRSVTNSRRTPG